jgi:RHS repeat-associated protein
MSQFNWFLTALLQIIVAPAFGQLAPTGEHYAGRASDTGYTGAPNKTGTYAATIPLDLPPARGGLPVPLQIVYGSHGAGAAGLGWDIPLSYVQRDRTFAHRRPLSASGALPVPPERAYLSLLGQTVELQQQGTSNQWLARTGTLALTVRQRYDLHQGISWEVDDGTGRLYTFVRPAIFGDTGIWLLDSVSAAGGARVELTYHTGSQTLDGGNGIQVNLARLRYNPHPTAVDCWKNEVVLDYGLSAHPLSLSILGDKILTRRSLLTRIDVESRATCEAPFERLRRYQFEYPSQGYDPDTGLPRLRAVRLFGREGTPEEFTSMPVAAYDYGTATQNGALRYQTTQPIALPADVALDEVAGTTLDASVSVPATGQPYAMWQTLIDVNGDGRPDLVFQKNNKLWVAYNQPAPGGATTIGAPQAIAQLSDATFSDGPFSTHTSTQPRFHYLPAKSNVVYVWRQAIDINGDGRVDIIDASEQPDRWVVYLNTPGPQGTVKWQRRSYSVAALRKTLTDFGHVVPNDYVPLSKKATGTNLKVWVCWKWSYDDNKWYWYSEGFVNHACEGVDGGVDGSSVERGQERTFVEWEVKDINGDGYPDVVFNSSPVTYQLNPPPDCTQPSCPIIGGNWTVRFGPGANTLKGPNNAIRAMFNVFGVRFYSDENPFAYSIDLRAPYAEQGIEQWACSNSDQTFEADFICPDGSLQSQVAGLVDVNGDGLVDRVWSNKAFLGTYAGPGATFSNVYLTLPGPLATQKSTYATACSPGSLQEPTADQIQGLRDLTGDGIPDYVDMSNGRVWIGTGAGFLHHVGIAVSGANFRFSHQTESCDGRVSKTDGGLFDIDGDGRPDIIGLDGNTWRVSRLSAGGAPEAGRLIQVDNGYGAVTHIDYVSAKTFTDNPIPFPEIVVSSVSTSGTQNLGGTLAGMRYAYSNAKLVFDSTQDRFAFPGYGRSIELRLVPSPRSAGDSDRKLIGAATVTDLWPLPEFQSWFSKADRWMHVQRTGRVSDVMTMRGSGTIDPWSLLNVDATDTRVIGVTHTEWGAKLFESPPNLAADLRNCIEMVDPFDLQVSAANAANGFDICRTHGFAYGKLTESWYGASPPPSTNNIQTRSQVVAVNDVDQVDEFGRAISVRYDNDVSTSDDDFCVENEFAAPVTTFPRVVTAVARRQVTDCDKRNVYASESFEYDHLPPGAVSDGRVTSHTVDRRDTTDGAFMKAVRMFDATYDPLGNVASVSTARDGATRTVSLDYDDFGLVPIHSTVQATGIQSMGQSSSVDPLSLAPLSTIDAYQVQRGNEFDGFGRWIRSTLTIPGNTEGVVATASYDGFSGPDPQGRRVTFTRYMDPVPAALLSSAVGHSKTTYLDELGRVRRSEVALGSDYNNESLVVGFRTYDAAGRVAFAARPYPKSQAAATQYGTTYYYKNTGDLDCLILGTGKQPFTQVTDVLNELYPTCFERAFNDYAMVTDRLDASSLQPNSAQAGVVHRIVSSAIGNAFEQSTLKAGTRLEYASFGHDRLGQVTSITRFLTPATGANPVRWTWRLDSLGQVLQLTEPESPPRFFEYSDWNELTGARWPDGPVQRQIVNRFDALGRLTGADERNNGVVDPATVRKFVYDTPADLWPYATPTFVLGRLSQASSPKGQVALGYDALGHVNAQAFRDDVGSIYANKFEFHPGGPLATLVFNLPDGNYADEPIKYEYDSAGRLRTIMAPGASGTHALYDASVIDPRGRVRKALYGGSSVFAADYAEHGRQLIREFDIGSPSGSRRMLLANFDASGRESARQEFVDGVGGSPTFFQYDALGRLATVQSMGATSTSWQFSYDALGNIRKLTDFLGNKDASLSYRAVDRDRICRIEYSQNLTGTDCNVAYDATGAMTGEPTRTGSRQISYFASGAVRTLSQGDSLASFAYDAFGRLQQLDVQSGSSPDQRRDRNYGALIQKRDIASGNATSTQIVRRVLGPGGIVATRRGPGDDWIYGFGDRRGNRFFVNDAGAFVQGVDYQPFGEAKSTGVQPGSVDYSSRQWNNGDALAAFGLLNMGARVYDPVIGRFLSRDPLLIAGSATTSNPYAFAVNDPINAADPSGLQSIPNLSIQSGSGSGGGGSAGPSVGPLVPNLEQTTEHFVSMFFGGGKAIAPTPSISTGPGGLYIVNMGDRPLADFTHDWAHEPIVEPWYMTASPPLALGVKWHDCGWPCRVVDVALLATGIGGLARLGTEAAIEGIGFTAAELGGAGTESTALALQAARYGAVGTTGLVSTSANAAKAVLGTYAPVAYGHEGNLVRLGNAFGYTRITTPSENFTDLVRLVQKGFTEIHLATGVHNAPAGEGFSVVGERLFLRLDDEAANVIMDRYPRVTVHVYDISHPDQWARFMGEQAAAASSPWPGYCTLSATCYSEILLDIVP